MMRPRHGLHANHPEFHASTASGRHLRRSPPGTGQRFERPSLTRQGPPLLRWVLYEAVRFAVRPGSPDHEYYLRMAARVGAQRATLAVARKLARRCQHRLRVLGEQAFAELPDPSRPDPAHRASAGRSLQHDGVRPAP